MVKEISTIFICCLRDKKQICNCQYQVKQKERTATETSKNKKTVLLS